jgi:hypothetical protein
MTEPETDRDSIDGVASEVPVPVVSRVCGREVPRCAELNRCLPKDVTA